MTPLPHPSATRLQNFVCTMLLHGNTPENVNLEVLASHNTWTSADELLVEFRLQQNGSRKLPEEVAVQVSVPTIDDGGEGE